jgi:type IV secretory pathway VirB2 component (pilin)
MQTIESPTETSEPSSQPIQTRARKSFAGRHLDVAFVVALVGPPVLIGLLLLLGLGFALAVCVVFAAVFVLTTAEDVTWMWQRRTDRQNQWEID